MSANKASQNMDALRRAVQAALPGLRWDEYHSTISPREYGDDLSVRLWGDGTFSAWGETLLRAGITHADEVAELLRAEVQKRADLAERAMGLRPRVELESELATLRESNTALQAALAAARVAAEKLWTDCRDDCASVQPFLPGRDCDCGAEIAIELRRALHRE